MTTLFAVPFTPAAALSEIAVNGRQFSVAADGSLDLGEAPDCDTLTAARVFGFVDRLPTDPATNMATVQAFLNQAQP